MIEALFPADVVVVRASDDMASSPLHPEEAAHTGRMVSKRLREFTLGRACARRALAELGIRDFPLLNDAQRAPIWPEGVVGSVTHCADLCAVAVARRGALRGLGLDAEPARDLDSAVLARVTTAAERARIAALPARADAGSWGLLAFSAKEAFYKCYFPIARTFLGFQDAEIEFQPESLRFVARLVRDDAPDALGARSFEGRFATSDRHLVTAVTLR